MFIGLVYSVFLRMNIPCNVLRRVNTGESTSKASINLVSIVNSSVSEW